MAKNIINNKLYIGKTITTFKNRKQQHLRYAFNYNSQTHFHRALRKYGKENFEWSIIKKCENEKELNETEIFYIDNFKSIKNGYNLTQGGEGSTGFTHSNKSKEKMSLDRKGKYTGKNNPMHIHNIDFSGERNPFYGKKHSPETLSKLSTIGKENTKVHFKSGSDNPMFAKHLTDDHKQKLSNASSKTWLITLPDNTEITFTSLRKFCQEYNLNYSYAKTCSRKNKPYKEFIFKLL
jgi:group I intron endonuclease